MPAVRRLMLVPLLATLLPLEAGAALGGPTSSVEADQARMQARREVKTGTAYSVHEITTPSGVNEAADELGQRVAHVFREVRLCVVELDPLPGDVAEFR